MLANTLDPEDFADVIRDYQSACTRAIASFEGEVLRYVGDGVLAVFGYRHTHEDDAQRAVHAALAIVSAVQAVRAVPACRDRPLAVRIGIASGVVLVGDLVGESAAEQRAVMGATPNLAARLQALARPNGIVIADDTRDLLGERFVCVDSGEHALRGFERPQRAWEILGRRVSERQLDTMSPTAAAPFVGRQNELSLILDLWREARSSRGRVLFLGGEAGIGKSRLVKEFHDRIRDDSVALFFQCSRYYAKTALYPLIDYIERSAGLGYEEGPAAKAGKVDAWLAREGVLRDAADVFKSLLGAAPHAGQDATASPLRQKERTFELFVGYLNRLASSSPLLVVVEDVHWADPTTLEFIDVLKRRARDMRVLVIATHRPDMPVELSAGGDVDRHSLGKLAANDAALLARNAAGDAASLDMLAAVVERAEGVPLFVQELVRAVRDRASAADAGQQARTGARLIPTTLRATLTSRLDQLGEARRIAECACVIGREFSHDLLEAIVDEPGRLDEALQHLEAAGLVRPRAGAAEGHTFSHDLVRDVAYDELTRSRRREIHARIASAIESRFPQVARDAPELVARHWTDAEEHTQRAVEAWLRAGRRASERSEHAEAIARLREGLDLISRLADEEERRRLELELVLVLGTNVITKEGGGLTEVGELYARALKLCGSAPECAAHFAAYWGWWRANMDLRHGREWADKLLALARTLDDGGLLLQAHHCQWPTLYMTGAHEECCEHVHAGLALYDRGRHHADASTYGGHDARVCALGELGVARWMLGFPDEGLRHVREALSDADSLQHVGSQAHALDYALVLNKFRRDAGAVLGLAERLVQLSTARQLRDHLAKGLFFRGWARARLHDLSAGLEEMERARRAFEEVGTPEDASIYYEMFAEVYLLLGRTDDALAVIEQAFAQTRRCGILFWNAELHRRYGEIMSAAGDPVAAASALREAMQCARSQSARSLELRAALSLASHTAAGADKAELARIYASFTEGWDTPDLRDANAFLERTT